LVVLVGCVAAAGCGHAGADADADANANADASASADANVVANADAGGNGSEDQDGDAGADGGADTNDGAAAPCATRITYGGAWIHGASHPASFDVAPGLVTWDGACTDDGANSYALLSNGFKPYFTGNSACVIALDASGCAGDAAACATRITYGASWLPAPNHPLDYDDVADRILWDGACTSGASASSATLSNGWTPSFALDGGAARCALSLRYTQCGGLYTNPVVAVDCPDPGVLEDGAGYVVACTSGDATDAFPIRTSPDLITWTAAGSIFPSASKPTWATGDFWAPEIHKVGAGYVAYFTARDTNGQLSIGAATSASALGPFVDTGAPLINEAAMGVIDAHEFQAPDGTLYLVWKDDGNAIGKPTPIHARTLAADGLSLTGTDTILITNDQAWEGAVTEAPWMIANGGEFFLFYSGGSYADATYAVGVARAPSPLGPFVKASAPIVATKGAWVGPGHCSIVSAPSGDLAIVEHGWASGHVNGPGDGRLLLVDRVAWGAGGWPTTIAPSTGSVAVP
jgi:arabinan endo-1,5-alpha-L-arabinosidase